MISTPLTHCHLGRQYIFRRARIVPVQLFPHSSRSSKMPTSSQRFIVQVISSAQLSSDQIHNALKMQRRPNNIQKCSCSNPIRSSIRSLPSAMSKKYNLIFDFILVVIFCHCLVFTATSRRFVGVNQLQVNAPASRTMSAPEVHFLIVVVREM